MPLKVSIVVPTFRPGKGLERVISSIDNQTLSPDQFELILIDDGSPDDTFERLTKLSATRANVRVKRIENSGWPSKPRNIGIELARGEYILFMDHDDYLYPDALRASYEYAKQHDSDVVSVKESKTTDVGWGITNFTANIPNARESRGIASLLPMMPHKLYQRKFLNEHHIRFPEGRRMLWEDVYFNVEAYRYARVISLLSDTPVYRWVHTGANNSSSYGPESTEFWARLKQLFQFIVETLPGDEFADARNTMIAHQYRTRLLGRFDLQLASGGDVGLQEALASIREIIEAYVPASIDDSLGKIVQARSHLLRRQEIDLMRRLREVEGATAGLTYVDTVEWRDGSLKICTVTRWIDLDSNEPLKLREAGGRLLRRLTPELEAEIPPTLLDVTDAVMAAATQLTIRSRDDYVTWPLHTDSKVRIERATEDTVTIEVVGETVVDLADAALGRPLGEYVWDFHARNTFMGMANHRAVRAGGTDKPALMGDRSAVAYTTQPGMLALDLCGELRNIVDGATYATAEATQVRQRFGYHSFSIPLDGVVVLESGRLTGTVGLQPFGGGLVKAVSGTTASRILRALIRRARPVGLFANACARQVEKLLAPHAAIIEGDTDGTRLRGRFLAMPGTYRMVTRFDDRPRVTPVIVRVSPTGAVTFAHL